MLTKKLLCLLTLAALPCCGMSAVNLPIDEGRFVAEILELKFGYLLEREGPLIFEEDLSWVPFSFFSEEDEYSVLLRDAQMYSPLLVEAVEDFWKRNSIPGTIESLEPIPFEHVVFSGPELEPDDSNEYVRAQIAAIREIQSAHPGMPILTLSQPGFSRDGSVGIIYLGSYSGPLFGGGGMRVFVRADGEWKEADWHIGMSWRS